MSASILGSVSHKDQVPGSRHATVGTFATSHLGNWMLQRAPHQRGCWYVQVHLRGLFVQGLAVQDDFGALQMVAV